MPLAAITPLRERWTVQVADGPDPEVKGNIVDHEYTIEDGCTKAAEVSKMWFRVADTYGVEVGRTQAGPCGDLGRYGGPGHDGAPRALIAGVLTRVDRRYPGGCPPMLWAP